MTVNPQERVFAALASMPRRQVIAFLSQTALSTTDLAARFGMSAPAVSRHLDDFPGLALQVGRGCKLRAAGKQRAQRKRGSASLQ